MNTPKQLAKHIREIHFGGNWTWSDLKMHLEDVSWEEAIRQVNGFNTIATLTFHMNYFVEAVISVLEGKPLDAHDKYSFSHPPIQSAADWRSMIDKTYADAERMASLVEQLPEEKLGSTFQEEKYGNYYRNILGVIEHCHYHLGQLVLVKKLIRTA